MSKRLTAERETEIRHDLATDYWGDYSAEAVTDLLAEIDALRSERDQAVERERALWTSCAVCGDCLLVEHPRCERHAHTEPGEDDWDGVHAAERAEHVGGKGDGNG